MKYCILETCLEMLKQRGYTDIRISHEFIQEKDQDYEFPDISIDNLSEFFKEIKYEIENGIISELVLIAKNKEEVVCIIFSGDLKLKVQHIRQYLGFMEKVNSSHCIIIHNEDITSSAKNTSVDSKDKKIELFVDKELYFNITKHERVPQHIVLSKKESEDFKTKYGIQFPHLLKNDPVSKFYSYDIGDIVEIHDLDDIVKYRIVVE